MNDKIDKMSVEELEQEMEKILAELDEHPESVNWEPPKEIDEKIFAEIRRREDERARKQLSEEDRKLLLYGKIYKKQMKRRKYWILAAVLVMALAVGMTCVGGPEKLVQKMTRGISGREVVLVDTDDGSVSATEGLSEEEAYEEIEKRFGFYPVRMDYLPEGIVFEEMVLCEEIQEAKMIYTIKDSAALYLWIRTDNRSGSWGVDFEDVTQQSYFVKNNSTNIEIKNYLVKENGQQRWRASFIYQDVSYVLVAHDLEQREFEEVIKNLIML